MHEAVLDANVLLRYLINQPEEVAERAAAILESAQEQRIALVVTSLTLSEVVYVLESVYHWERSTIAERLLELISVPMLRLLEQDTVVQALSWYRDISVVHFADAYIAAVAMARGHNTVVSFDRGLRRMQDITLIQDSSQLHDR